MKFAIIAITATVLASQTLAQETAPVVETATPVKVELVASPELVAQFNAICSANFVLSEKAAIACAMETVPKPNKAQTMFKNTGIGIEFNTLARQMTQ